MAKGDYYFKLFYQRLLTSTTGWDDEKFGAYLRLLIYQFDKGSIPKDLLPGIFTSHKKNWKFLSKKFIESNGKFKNNFMSEVRDNATEKKEKLRGNGAKGGRPKNQMVSEDKPNGYENGKQTESYTNKPISQKEIYKEKFEVFRKNFPGKKRGLETEFKNFCAKHSDWKQVLEKLNPAILAEIEDRKSRIAKSVWVPEWKILHTWINQRCWEQEFEISIDEAIQLNPFYDKDKQHRIDNFKHQRIPITEPEDLEYMQLTRQK